MAHIWNFKRALLVGCIVSSVDLHAWQTLIGNDNSRTDQTFSFGIKAHCAQPANGLILVGAESAQEGKEYSLAKIALHDHKITPCAPVMVMLNGVYDQPNPLYNAAISHIVCPTSTYAVVHNPAHRSILYATNHYGTDVEMITVEVKDAQNQPVDQINHVATNGQNLIFAATKTQELGICGVAVLTYSEKTEKKEISPEEFKKLQKDAEEAQKKEDTKTFVRLKKGLEMGQDNKPYRNVTTRSLVQEHAMVELPAYVKQVTALAWHPGVGCLYVAVSYVVPIEEQVCGFFVGKLQKDNTITLERVDASIDLFREGSIEELVPFSTTTGALDYILIKNSAMPCQVHSLGVCNQRLLDLRETFKHLGVVADVTQKPQDIFESKRSKFLGRQFAKPFAPQADTPLLVAHDVGCGYLYAGPISHLQVIGDVVFATVTEPADGYTGGVYQSQALYDACGRISGWTLWQKTVERDGVDFAHINNAKANMMIFAKDTHGEKGTRNICVNKWPEQASDEIARLVEVAQKEFVESQQEIKKVIDFSILTPGVAGKNLTLLMGDTKLALVQMPEFATVTFDQKMIEPVGTPTCAQIGISDDQGWLFVGGTHGLAKLAHVDGSGWNMPAGLQHIYQIADCVAQRVGTYTMVRKILFDQGFLYVLTDTQFDRIDLRTNAIISLATTQQLCNQRYAIFYDAVVSDKVALLATSAGLYRVGNGRSCMCDESESIQWTPVKVPEATDLPLFLLPHSMSGNPHDWAKGSGQLHIITGSYTKKGAHVHRFAVQDVTSQEITDSTIAPVADLVFKDRISDIGSLLVCSDCFLTDGTFYLAPFKIKKSKPMILYNGLTKSRSTINLGLQVDDTITCITRNSRHGNWLVAGSFGLKTNI